MESRRKGEPAAGAPAAAVGARPPPAHVRQRIQVRDLFHFERQDKTRPPLQQIVLAAVATSWARSIFYRVLLTLNGYHCAGPGCQSQEHWL